MTNTNTWKLYEYFLGNRDSCINILYVIIMDIYVYYGELSCNVRPPIQFSPSQILRNRKWWLYERIQRKIAMPRLEKWKKAIIEICRVTCRRHVWHVNISKDTRLVCKAPFFLVTFDNKLCLHFLKCHNLNATP